MKASGMCGSDLHQYRRPKSGGEAIGALAIKLPLPPGALATLWQAGDRFYRRLSEDLSRAFMKPPMRGSSIAMATST
jgi:hypothetical protein